MTSLSYVEAVKMLFKNGDLIKVDIEHSVHPQALMRLHAIVGIIGESKEFHKSQTRDNDLEELGDLLFYATALLQVRFYSNYVGDECLNDQYPNKDASDLMAEMLDLSKKEVIYAQTISEEKRRVFDSYANSLYAKLLASIPGFGFSVEEIKDANIAKLSKRYPSLNYSNQAAQERLDKPAGE